MISEDIDHHAWKKRMDAMLPSNAIHSPSVPPVMEILSLLMIAMRISSYIQEQKSLRKEPIFDLRGPTLQPPNPGPHAGAPIGGVGSGAIGLGYKLDFRRWSIHPGRYIHKAITADIFAVRIEREGKVAEAVVLSLLKPEKSSCLHSWSWNLSPTSGEYNALFPRAWIHYTNPLPGIDVIVKQVSPFLPGVYSESSLPLGLFEVEVINKMDEDIDSSVMFVFQNGLDYGDDPDRPLESCAHSSFAFDETNTKTDHNQNHDETLSYDAKDFLSKHQTQRIAGIVMQQSYSRIFLEEETEYESTTKVDKDHVHAIDRSLDDTDDDDNENDSIQARFTACSNSCAFPAVSSHLFSPQTNSSNNTTGTTGNIDTILESQSEIMQTNKHDGTSINVKESIRISRQEVQYTDQGTFTIAGMKTEDDERMTTCTRFITQAGIYTPYLPFTSCPDTTLCASAKKLWEQFVQDGHIADITSAFFMKESKHLVEDMPLNESRIRLGAAVCIQKHIPKQSHKHIPSSKTFQFSLSWNFPIVRFGSTKALPRFYTKYFPSFQPTPHDNSLIISSKALITSSISLAVYGLLRAKDWLDYILQWQVSVIASIKSVKQSKQSSSSHEENHNAYYYSQLFNELYYLVDGGCCWLNSAHGRPNDTSLQSSTSVPGVIVPDHNNHSMSLSCSSPVTTSESIASTSNDQSIPIHSNALLQESALEAFEKAPDSIPSLTLRDIAQILQHCYSDEHKYLQVVGQQEEIGQFLYLEGHEYLMYNTYDVHFYASYALLMVFPQLEFSLQTDIVQSIMEENNEERVMMGEGVLGIRKVFGAVPHDVGSPSDEPWGKYVNAYNFQDVSNWKDLSSKLILQLYRNYYFTSLKLQHKHLLDYSLDAIHPITKQLTVREKEHILQVKQHELQKYVVDKYSILLAVMHKMEEDYVLGKQTEGIGCYKQSNEASFDDPAQYFDHDGMIRNSGFPDQTYDIWVATGVHCYCGGLWIAACFAMAKMAALAGVPAEETRYTRLGRLAKRTYTKELFAQFYVQYDNSSSAHHDSIMADMLAGQWYARACALENILDGNIAFSASSSPSSSSSPFLVQSNNTTHSMTRIYSCLKMIYFYNVLVFGKGKSRGAVNGMRPSFLTLSSSSSSSTTALSLGATSIRDREEERAQRTEQEAVRDSIGQTILSTSDVHALQSLAMQDKQSTFDSTCIQSREVWTGTTYAVAATMLQEAFLSTEDDEEHREELERMAWHTAQGIHDFGWKECGYHFATPEGWMQNGQYRSLGYMRALAIWSMQYAIQLKYYQTHTEETESSDVAGAETKEEKEIEEEVKEANKEELQEITF